MAARATWKGSLQISLVTIPIKVFPATEPSPTIALHQLHDCPSPNPPTRIQQKKSCPTCQREVPGAEILKGYEVAPGQHVILQEGELAGITPDSSRVIHLTQFGHERALDFLHIDRSYYLGPDGAGGTYAVICEGLAGKVGTGKWTTGGREMLVAVRAIGAGAATVRTGLVLHTLHHAAEIRSMDDALHGMLPGTADRDAVLSAQQLIAALTDPGPLDLVHHVDQYQVDLKHLIDDKIAGHEIVNSPALEPTPVLSLMEALRQSLDALHAAKKLPAKFVTKNSRALGRNRDKEKAS